MTLNISYVQFFIHPDKEIGCPFKLGNSPGTLAQDGYFQYFLKVKINFTNLAKTVGGSYTAILCKNSPPHATLHA